MRKVLKKFELFITFDSPLDNRYISHFFIITHKRYKIVDAHWCLSGTRRKVIASYWFRDVLIHFSAIVGIAALYGLLVNCPNFMFLMAVFSTGLFAFAVLFTLHYWPSFYSDFLPKLDSIVARHEQETMSEKKLEKCRRTQFSIPTLTIILYVFSKNCGFPFPACTDRSAELLNNLYGSDKDKIKENLRRLYKLSTLSVRERAEVQKGINQARAFFEALEHRPANDILDELELKVQKSGQ
jgi:hypothetical protein